MPEFKKILKLSNDFVKKNNAKLYFLYLPEYMRYKDKNCNGQTQYYLSVKKIVKDEGIEFIDIHKMFLQKNYILLIFSLLNCQVTIMS